MPRKTPRSNTAMSSQFTRVLRWPDADAGVVDGVEAAEGVESVADHALTSGSR
jgi:hypothetical protein